MCPSTSPCHLLFENSNYTYSYNCLPVFAAVHIRRFCLKHRYRVRSGLCVLVTPKQLGLIYRFQSQNRGILSFPGETELLRSLRSYFLSKEAEQQTIIGTNSPKILQRPSMECKSVCEASRFRFVSALVLC